MSAPASSLRKEVDQLLGQGQFARAVPLLKQLARMEPRDSQITRVLGIAYFQTGQFPEAAKCFEKVLALTANRDSSTLCDLARSYAMALQDEAAIKTFAEALDRGATDPDAIAQLAQLYEKKGRFSELEQVLRRAVQLHPGNKSFAVYLAEELVDIGNAAEASLALGDTASLTLDDPRFQIRAALVLQQVGRPGDALTLLSTAATHDAAPSLVHGLLRQSLKAVHGDHLLEAIRAMVAESGHHALKFQLALQLSEEDLLDEAEKVLDSVGARIPDNLVLELRARIGLGRGDLAQANACFDKVWDRVADNFRGKEPAPGPAPPKPARRTVAPLVYMPIEVGERELSSRIYIALFAAQKGLSSLIAPTHTVSTFAAELPAGVFLHKTLNSVDRRKITDSLAGGHVFSAIDEESMAWTGGHILLGVDPTAATLMDMIFVAGPAHARAYHDVFPEAADKLRVVGNPRIDLLSPQLRSQFDAQVRNIRARHGRFVLICTSFAQVSSTNFNFEGFCEVYFRVTSPKAATKDFDSVLALGRSTVYAAGAYRAALEVILPKIAEQSPDIRFVIRVHPAESPEYWRRITDTYPNVVLEGGGSLHPWLFAAEATLYMAGCSTGLEAFLAGVPTLRLLVDPSLAAPQHGLSYGLNDLVTSAEDITAKIRALPWDRSEDPAYQAQREVVADHILVGPQLAAVRIAAGLSELQSRFESKRLMNAAAVKADLDLLLTQGARLSRRKFRGDPGMARKLVAIDKDAVEEVMRTAVTAFGLDINVDVARAGTDSILISPVRI